MIVKEYINGRLIKHSSDNGFYIKQIETGIEYAEAIDVIPCRYTYEETDRTIEEETQNIISERED